MPYVRSMPRWSGRSQVWTTGFGVGRFIPMIHYTMNTGHAADSPRSGVGHEAVATLAPLLKRGGGAIPGCAPFRFTTTQDDGAAVFTVWRGQEPLVTCGLAWTDADAGIWRVLEELYLELTDKHPRMMAPAQIPEKPGALPWLGVVLLPALLNQRPADVGWLGDFERSLAWTILHDQGVD